MAELRIATPVRLQGVQPRDTRSAGVIGESVARLAGTVGQAAADMAETDQRILDQQAALKRQQIEEEDRRLTLAQAADLAARAERLRTRVAERRLEAGPGAAGFEEAVAAELDSELASFDLNFGGNARVAEQFADNVAQLRGRVLGEARIETMRATAVQQGNDWAAMSDTLINGVLRDPTPARRAEALEIAATAMASLTGLTAEQRSEAGREFNRRVTLALAQGQIGAGNDQAVGQMVSSGQFDAILAPEDIGRITGQVDAAARARELEAERQAAEAQRAVREQVALLKARVDAGEQPSPAEFEAARAAAASAGLDPSDVYQIGVMAEDALDNRAMAGASAGELERERARLEDKAARGEANQTELRRLNRLGPMAEARRRSEAGRYRDTFQAGAQGRATVAQQIAADTPDPAEQFRRGEALEDGFGYIVTLPQQFQGTAINGRELLRTDSSIAPDQHVRREFRRLTGGVGDRGALRAFQPSAQEGVQDTATALYVGRGGRFDGQGQPTNPRAWDLAVTNALGGTRGNGEPRGGLATWRGEPFVLPTFMTARRFSELIAAVPFSEARFADGTAATRAQVSEMTVPVYIGQAEDGAAEYVFEARRGPNAVGPAARLKRSDGADFVLRVTR